MTKLRIELIDWHWECGDGCCDEYGTKLLVDGITVLQHCELSKEQLATLLSALNVEHEEIEHKFDY